MKFPIRIVSRPRYELLKLSARGVRLQTRMNQLQDAERENDSIVCHASLAALPPQDSFSIIDVGANIGEVSLAFSRLFPHANIFSVEADPTTFQTLQKNTRNVPAIHPINNAIHSRSGTVDFRSHRDSLFSSMIELPDAQAATTLIKIQAKTLDELVAEHRISQVALLKVDTEGNDLEVLKGAGELLRSPSLKYVICEFGIHPENKRNLHINHLVSFVAPNGFHVSKLGGFGCCDVDLFGNVLFERK